MEPLIDGPIHVLAVLLAVLAALFALQSTRAGKRLYQFVPILVFCYFVPTLLSNTGVIPNRGDFSLYVFIKDWLLMASLLLLVLSVDLGAILRLGRNVLILFLTSVVSIVLAGPLAFLLFSWMFDAESSAEAWKGLAALCGSWIGGGANMTAIKESVGASDDVLGAIVVIDVAIAEIWTAVLFWFAGREQAMDAAVGADRRSLEEVRRKAEAYQAKVTRPTDLGSLLAIGALAFVCAVAAHELSGWVVAVVPENDILSRFAWKVILVTLFGIGLSFTRLRRLEGVGAGQVGSVFLYLLVASIGAKAHFAEVANPDRLPMVVVGAAWMVIHVAVLLAVRRALKAPIFFAAVGSRACIGGAASAPIVAAAFNPALVPVAVLLAIGGYVLGTFGGLLCAALFELVHVTVHG